MKINIFLIFAATVIFASTVLLLTSNTSDKENSSRRAALSALYKERLLACIEKDDDLLLNNLLDFLKKQPEVLKISISENGRIIADTETGDLNTIFEKAPFYTKTIHSDEVLTKEAFTIKNKKYRLYLLLAKKTSVEIKSLIVRLEIAALIYLTLCGLLLAGPGKNKISLKEEKTLTPLDTADTLSFLAGSKTAVVLVLSGDNRVLKASTKALELFGENICGKNIAELESFGIITGAIENGREPVFSGGKKYFVL